MKNVPAAKKHTLRNILLITLPLLAGLAVIYLLRNPKNPKGTQTAQDSVKKSQASQPIKAIDSSQFPIKQSSVGDMVKQLQNALIAAYGTAVLPKYGADGNLGSETIAGLKKAGVAVPINSQADYDAALSKIRSVKSIAENSSRADDLLSRWQNSTTLQLMPVGSSIVVMYGVTIDVYNNVSLNGMQSGLAPGLKYNRTDYVLSGDTDNGYVLVNITSGPVAGTYKVLASQITLG